MTRQTNNGTITILKTGRAYQGLYADGTLVYRRTTTFDSIAKLVAAVNASARSAMHANAIR